MNKNSNVTNKRWSAINCYKAEVSYLREKARNAAHARKVESNDGDISMTPWQKEALIVLYAQCKRHGVPANKEVKHPRNKYEAGQNIKALKWRLKNVLGPNVFRAEYNKLFEIYERRKNERANGKADQGDQTVCKQNGGAL